MLNMNFQLLDENFPADFHGTHGKTILEIVTALIESQCKTPLNRWYELFSRYGVFEDIPFQKFDYSGDGSEYMAMFLDPEISLVKAGVGTPDFDNYDWPEKIKNKCASLIIAFFTDEGCAGLRTVVVNVDGRIEEVRDFGIGENWRQRTDEWNIAEVLGKYAGIK